MLPPGVMTNNLDNLLKDSSVEIGIELVGGTTFAKTIVEQLLKAGKHVVTAVSPIGAFYKAEDYHQQYDEKSGTHSCAIHLSTGI